MFNIRLVLNGLANLVVCMHVAVYDKIGGNKLFLFVTYFVLLFVVQKGISHLLKADTRRRQYVFAVTVLLAALGEVLVGEAHFHISRNVGSDQKYGRQAILEHWERRDTYHRERGRASTTTYLVVGLFFVLSDFAFSHAVLLSNKDAIRTRALGGYWSYGTCDLLTAMAVVATVLRLNAFQTYRNEKGRVIGLPVPFYYHSGYGYAFEEHIRFSAGHLFLDLTLLVAFWYFVRLSCELIVPLVTRGILHVITSMQRTLRGERS